MGKYITVIDHKIGRIFQYENLELFKDGWNGDENDIENIKWYLTTVKDHNLRDISWIAHDNIEVITN